MTLSTHAEAAVLHGRHAVSVKKQSVTERSEFSQSFTAVLLMEKPGAKTLYALRVQFPEKGTQTAVLGIP